MRRLIILGALVAVLVLWLLLERDVSRSGDSEQTTDEVHSVVCSDSSDGTGVEVRVLRRVSPTLPSHLPPYGQAYEIEMTFCVSETGRSRGASVVSSRPDHQMDDAALAALAEWLFEPHIREGKPLELCGCRVSIRLEFEE